MPIVKPSLPQGLDFFTAADGRHYDGRDNILFVKLARQTRAAASFTQSSLPAWPVQWSQSGLAARKGAIGALLVNAGNANAANGAAGKKTAAACAREIAKYAGFPPEAVMLASTGIIGEPLAFAPIKAALNRLAPASLTKAAKAIMTTDSRPKIARTSFVPAKGAPPIHLVGMAKGAAMLAPNMATMLAFIFTDARLPASFLRQTLKDGLGSSFNAVSVDGDTSTNDMVALFATGVKPLPQGKARQRFADAVAEMMQNLALQMVRDGEGAKKLIETSITGAASLKAAHLLARTIGESPLVRTAIAGGDGNWGRILMAVGKTGLPLKQERLTLKIGGVPLFRRGKPVRLNPQAARTLRTYLKSAHVLIQLEVGQGRGEAQFWSSDLTEEYVRLNADYRT